ncbi:hypothetical protein LNQ49_06415 [Flavobacterium sp. F-65]|uniref:Uncharacterized protein n=1 Tax=Flavobacterium pisciphilum TaxID=2893755 RepID=A0ABS8MR46_9FLAO|nr:hypothetical protein [Flavobacterium sp. F-65]MCC9071226.1 hypothetical protein [Flavobacterium sp. F-65]
MKKQEIQSNALDLLNEFIASAPDEVQEIINKHKKSDIDGPTYYEYLTSIDENSILIDCNNSEVEVEYIRATATTFAFLADPPKLISNRKRKIKKDSVISQSLFF